MIVVFWAADPMGTMSYRTGGEFPYVCTSVHMYIHLFILSPLGLQFPPLPQAHKALSPLTPGPQPPSWVPSLPLKKTRQTEILPIGSAALLLTKHDKETGQNVYSRADGITDHCRPCRALVRLLIEKKKTDRVFNDAS